MSSVAARVEDDGQLARLLQIGIVLEEVVEARAYQHYQRLPADERDERIEALLADAREESHRHRQRLEELVNGLDAATIPFEDIQELVGAQYAQTRPEDFDGVLYDQLNGEETAYKFYDDLIDAIESSTVEFSVPRDDLLTTLREIRQAEAEGVEEVADLMEARA